ncbi:benzoate/H(+) symporter BenE family transporter [Mycetocola spongiae]|uniref:benzoate/H(+) symporter BenE family transporter n=1 Tax=Mycetocola spongiae TaxID=2859226 RepID=UPI001CF10315|nr:benzoate/H(+) symporter BenE family transporter [Mycetocola spongiae]UCR89636.1 benzoate/H(+) symporter BenE family transporter [Mycetocola spongiae]
MKTNDSTTATARIPILPRSDFSASAAIAGVISVLVNFSGPFVIILEATRAAGLSEAQTASWVWALCLGCGISGLVLTLFTRVPVIVAWSTPGAALLIASLGGFSFSDAVGAFLVASLAAAACGFSGLFGAIMDRVPAPLLSALLAGILLPFIVRAGSGLVTAPVLAGAVLLAFLLGRRYLERYAVVLALGAGLLAAALTGSFRPVMVEFLPTMPVWTTPTFNPAALIGIALPLFIVTMAAQNAPGLALLRAEHYVVNERLLVGGISTVSALLTPWGGHAINLGAITAAICTGPEAHPDPARRYVAGISSALAYLLAALGGGVIVAAFRALPPELVSALAGVARLSSALTALAGAVGTGGGAAIPALLTLAVTMSGIVILGVGSAFWGLLIGALATPLLARPKTGRRPRPAA